MESILYTEAAPGWYVDGAADLSTCFAGDVRGSVIRRFRDRAVACRYTWERWSLRVLGEAVWDYDDTSEPTVKFGDLTVMCMAPRMRGDTWEWWWRTSQMHTDPVACLVDAALESLRRRV